MYKVLRRPRRSQLSNFCWKVRTGLFALPLSSLIRPLHTFGDQLQADLLSLKLMDGIASDRLSLGLARDATKLPMGRIDGGGGALDGGIRDAKWQSKHAIHFNSLYLRTIRVRRNLHQLLSASSDDHPASRLRVESAHWILGSPVAQLLHWNKH